MSAEHGKISKWMIAAMLAVLVVVTTVSMTVFQHTAIESIKRDARSLLSDSASDQSRVLASAMKTCYSLLESAAVTVVPDNAGNSALISKKLSSIKSISDYLDICYALPNGETWCNGEAGVSVEDRDYFIQSMNGARGFQIVTSKRDGKRRFVLSVPVYSEDESSVEGVIFGVCNEEKFSQCVEGSIYDDMLTLVFAGNGDYITGSGNAVTYTNESLEAGRENSTLSPGSEEAKLIIDDFAAGHCGSKEYILNGVRQYAVYQSVGFSDWMIWVTVPTSVLNSEAYETVTQGYALICVVLCTAAVFILLIVGLFRRNTRILLADQALLRESEARYRIALENTTVTIWDYDVINHTITHDERSKTIHGIPETVIENVPESLIQRGYIHPDSADAMREMYKRIENGEKFVTGVFRVRTADGSDWWFERIKYNCLMDGRNKPYHAIGMSENVTEEQDERRRIDELNAAAECDSMTGIYNHDAAIAHIKKYLSIEGTGAKHALFMIDIDDFKRINDTLGHQCGDETIKRIAQRIKGVFRASDIVGRIGGDEFMVLMKNMPDERLAQRKGEELVNALRINVSSGNRSDMQVTASVGIVICTDNVNNNFEALYSKADSLLYSVKTSGKDNFMIGCE